MSESAGEITRILSDLRNGDRDSEGRLISLVYRELRRIAAYHLKRERPGHTLQTTALVHEAYLRLVGQEIQWQGPAHFFAVAAPAMRRVLVDHARTPHASKSARGRPKLALAESLIYAPGRS